MNELTKKQKQQIKKEIDLILLGAGIQWIVDGYFEFNDNNMRCISNAIYAFELQFDISILICDIRMFSTLKKLHNGIIDKIQCNKKCTYLIQ